MCSFELKKDLCISKRKIIEGKILRKQLLRKIQDANVELALQQAHLKVAMDENLIFSDANQRSIKEAQEELIQET